MEGTIVWVPMVTKVVETRNAPQAPESTAKKAFDFNSTVDSRRLSTLVYHSAHGISNIPSNILRIFPVDILPLAGRQSTPGLVTRLVMLNTMLNTHENHTNASGGVGRRGHRKCQGHQCDYVTSLKID
eukprot:1176914-Prorocentrum_minimum.AAC.6